jgi:transposase InsO family protein
MTRFFSLLAPTLQERQQRVLIRIEFFSGWRLTPGTTAATIPRSTVQRRMGELTKLGAIERNGTRFLLSVSYLNKPGILEGFKRRVDVVKGAPKKLDWTSGLT